MGLGLGISFVLVVVHDFVTTYIWPGLFSSY